MDQHGGNSQLGSLAAGGGELGEVKRDAGADSAATNGVGADRRAAAADERDATRGTARRGRCRGRLFEADCRLMRRWRARPVRGRVVAAA